MENQVFPGRFHLPEEIVDQIVSYVDEARDIAACNCVSRLWNQRFSRLTTVRMTDRSFRHLISRHVYVQNAIIRLLPRLEKVSLHTSLRSWDVYSLVSPSPTLRHLNLKETGAVYGCLIRRCCSSRKRINSLETLSLRHFCLSVDELWWAFPGLTSLELVDVNISLGENIFCHRNCPNLVNLVISAKAEENNLVRIYMPNLERCSIQLDTVSSTFHLGSPKIKSVNLQGFSSISLSNTESLQSLSIDNAWRMDTFQFEGGFPVLEYLSMTGCPWCWYRLSKAVKSATNIKHLSLTHCDDIYYNIQCQELHIVDFFLKYPNLEKLQLNNNMLRVLSVNEEAPHDTMRKRLLAKDFHLQDLSDVFWNLKEVAMMLSPSSRARPKIENLEFMIKYGENLKIIQLLIPMARGDNPRLKRELSFYNFLSSYLNIGRIQRPVRNMEYKCYNHRRLCALD